MEFEVEYFTQRKHQKASTTAETISHVTENLDIGQTF